MPTMTTEQVADLFRTSPRRINRLARRQKLQVTETPDGPRFTEDAVRIFIASNTVR